MHTELIAESFQSAAQRVEEADGLPAGTLTRDLIDKYGEGFIASPAAKESVISTIAQSLDLYDEPTATWEWVH